VMLNALRTPISLIDFLGRRILRTDRLLQITKKRWRTSVLTTE
jgi:hypothetical protein